MDDARKELIETLAKDVELKSIRFGNLGMMNTPTETDERIKSRQQYELARAELSDAQFKLNQAVNHGAL